MKHVVCFWNSLCDIVAVQLYINTDMLRNKWFRTTLILSWNMIDSSCVTPGSWRFPTYLYSCFSLSPFCVVSSHLVSDFLCFLGQLASTVDKCQNVLLFWLSLMIDWTCLTGGFSSHAQRCLVHINLENAFYYVKCAYLFSISLFTELKAKWIRNSIILTYAML